MSRFSCLSDYESLVQQHREQFTPALAQLETSVSDRLNQLRQQERSLVEAQVQQLAQIHTQLATDGRYLLNSTELQAFVAEVQTIPARSRWNQAEPPLEADANPANWQLVQTQLALAIRDYETTVDHDAYDDERTHSAYGYRVTIQVGEQSRAIEVLTQRVYSPVETRPYNLQLQLEYYVEETVSELLSQQNITASPELLAREISYLFGCAARLLSLTPQTVQFHYSSAEAVA